MNLPKKIIILDTETISIDKPYIYDLGYIIAELVDGRYIAIESHQQIIQQIYDNMALFSTAYYQNKRLLYTSLMKGKRAKKEKYGFALQQLKRLMEYHGIDTLSAYNSPFDRKALKFTTDFFKTKNIFENKNWLDIHAIANEYIHKQKNYIDFTTKNGFFGKSGYIQTNAEITYAFLTDNVNYKEQHTSLADCYIELEILNECIRLGFDNTKEIKKDFILTPSYQTLTIKSKEKTYTFKYQKKIKRKNGIIELI